MNEQFGILHLSDIHASEKSKVTIQHLVDLLKTDLLAVQDRYNVPIKIICISGDLINSGDNSTVELDIILSDLLQPLMDMLNLDEKSIFMVAGNHEIKRQMVDPYNEAGLNSKLVSESDIDEFLDSINTDSLKRIEYFDSDFADMFGGDPVWRNSLGRAHIVTTDSIKIGVSCLNSAWRSTGIGSAEKGKMVIGRKQIIDSYESIKDADLKICIAHHPFDWLTDVDKSAVEKCISQYDIVLTGHIHESDTKVYTSFNGQTLFNTCGKFDNSSDIYNGYSILAVNPYNKDCNVILRQYFGYPRNCFDEALCVVQDGCFSTSLGAKDENLGRTQNMKKKLHTATKRLTTMISSHSRKFVETSKMSSYWEKKKSGKRPYCIILQNTVFQTSMF